MFSWKKSVLDKTGTDDEKNDSLREFKMNKIITTNMSLYNVKLSRIRKGENFHIDEI